MTELVQMWTQMLQDTASSVINLAPRILVGIVSIIVALIVAKLVERALRAFMVRLRFDSMIERVGFDQALGRIGVRESLDKVIPRIVYFLLLILFARTAFDAMGLTAVSSAIAAFMAYIPNIVAAVLILLFGSAAAQWAGSAAADAGRNSGIEFAPSLGRAVSALLLFVVGVMAIGQLKFDTEMVRLVTSAMLAAMALAFGLSFGLGSRDITRNILAGFYARKTFEIGEEMEVRGERGKLVSITPMQTLLEHDGGIIAVANSAYLEDTVRQ